MCPHFNARARALLQQLVIAKQHADVWEARVCEEGEGKDKYKKKKITRTVEDFVELARGRVKDEIRDDLDLRRLGCEFRT
jgi:hypothetical protein